MIGSFAFSGRSPRLFAALGLVGLCSLPAQAVEYDGMWNFAMTCPASGAQRAFTDRFQAAITDNVINRTRTARNGDDVTRVTGRVQNTQMNVTIDRARGSDRWTLRFAGPANSDTRFELTGGLFVADRQARTCELIAEAVTPAANSLAATAPGRERQRVVTELAAAQAALATAQRDAEASQTALQTELDLARFEGASMRTELTERARAAAAQTAAHAASLAEANARLTQAQAAATQAAATAAQQRTALEARATAAEAQAAQAQAAATQAAAAAAQQRTALEARATAAEARATQAEAAATQQRAALEARATAAEARATQAQAAMAQLRTELEQARAAQPPR